MHILGENRSFPSQAPSFTDIRQPMSDNGEQPFHFTNIRQAVRDQNSKGKNEEPNIVYMSWAEVGQIKNRKIRV